MRSSTKKGSSLRSAIVRRLLLWSAPVVAAVSGLATLTHVRATEQLHEARSLLAAGKAGAAEAVLAELTEIPTIAARARGGLAVAAAWGERSLTASTATLDTSPYPLAALARRAFEAGRFEAVLGLIELAEKQGRPTVPVVRHAALIELGRWDEIESAGIPRSDSRLARHVSQYLEPPPSGSGHSVVLRDRTGQHLGRLSEAGELVLAEGVRPEWVPRAAAEAAWHEGAQHGETVSMRLTLDLELSELAHDVLGAYRGTIVLLDPRTGHLLAAVSDEQSLAEGGTPAFEQYREPASIAKLITTTAALRAGIDPDAEIAKMTCEGHRRYDGKFLYCPYIAGPLRGLDRALAVSCNVAFADLGVRVGRRRMIEEFRRYGFDRPLGPIPGGRIVEPRGDDRQLADLSIGLEATDVTPLYAALLAAVMANDGVMTRPTLVHAVDGRLGFHPRRLPPGEGRQVIETEWLPVLLRAMTEVTRRGTASRLAPYNFPVAMKTGTASHPRWGFHVNYVGVGPMPAPHLAFSVRITHQRTSRRVRDAAKSVTRRLLRELGRVSDERGWRDRDDASPSPDRIHRLAGTRRVWGAKDDQGLAVSL